MQRIDCRLLIAIHKKINDFLRASVYRVDLLKVQRRNKQNTEILAAPE